VQLAKVRYVDSQKKLPDLQRFGFLIENENELAGRLSGRILEEEHGPVKSIDKAQYKLFTVFQYMVGNTDWSLNNRHNAMLILPQESELPMPFPVPYDFDFSGMVDAPYAVPHYTMPIASVKERFFQWRGDQKEDFSDVFALFSSKKEQMLQMCRTFEPLNAECRAGVVSYLESFYELLEKPEQIVGRE
jgi:hypothetical protein